MQNQLAQSLYEIGAIQFGEFTLKSGQTSPIYINLRKIISYPTLLRTIATLMWDKMQFYSFDLVCGVPYTALPIATCISLEHHIPMIIRRKEKKDYGTKQLIEGVYSPRQTCIIIEDVITTGISVIETATDLENAGLKVKNVIVLIDREQGGKKNLSEKYHVDAVLPLSDILNSLLASSLLAHSERTSIQKFLQERYA